MFAQVWQTLIDAININVMPVVKRESTGNDRIANAGAFLYGDLACFLESIGKVEKVAFAICLASNWAMIMMMESEV